MACLIDTDVAILMRDSNDLTPFLAGLSPPVFLSAVSRIELENGVYRDPSLAPIRRAALDLILSNLPTVDFGEAEIEAYRAILTVADYARARVMDRMIAATALTNDLELVTMNGRDFADVPGLRLRVWPAS